MFKIIKKAQVSDLVYLYEFHYPLLAQKAQAGQFIIIKISEDGERIPITIADSDPKTGLVTMIVQNVGKTTHLLSLLNEGDIISNIIGPLGVASHIENYGTVLCVGGGVGIAAIYPITRALKNAGNTVISILGARSKNLLFWEDKFKAISSELYIATDDGSTGQKGLVTDIEKKLITERTINKIFAVGPAIMMKFVVETARPKNISTIVSLNSIMVDGTGMCGGCRVTVAGKPQFACVDGPDFEGLDVDFNNLMNRSSYYKTEEHACYIGLNKLP